MHSSTDGHIPTERLEDQHAFLFALWALKQAKKPQNRDDLLDAYERYVESRGASRTIRRACIIRFDFPLRRVLGGMLSEKLIREEPNFSFSLTDKGREAAKGLKRPPVPQSIWGVL